MKKSNMIRSALAVAAAAGVFMSFGWSFFELMIHCKKDQKHEIRRKWFDLNHIKINHPRHKFEQKYEDGKAWCRGQEMKDCWMVSADGLKLHASYLPAEDPERFVILCHGYKGSGFGDFANIARFLHENHCNLLFIDQRCCGQSEGEFITFGAKEKYDVQRWAYYTAKRNKEKLPVYLYGMSMGAASVLMASGEGLPRDVRGLIADCGFRSMRGQLQDIAANWFHLHWVKLLLFRIDLFCRMLGGFAMKEADTAQAIKENRKPVLFFHGLMDTYVDPKNTRYNYTACKAPKELVMVPQARHLCASYEAEGMYRETLLKFFAIWDRYLEPGR